MKILTEYSNQILEALSDKKVLENLDVFVSLLSSIRYWKESIITCGNGGSAATASHFAQDLLHTCNINARCLNDNVGLITAIGNDQGFENIFSSQIIVPSLDKKTLLIVFSGSGNSKNIIKIVNLFKFYNLVTCGITGTDGGELSKIVKLNLNIQLPMRMAESAHSILCHYIVERLIDEKSY